MGKSAEIVIYLGVQDVGKFRVAKKQYGGIKT